MSSSMFLELDFELALQMKQIEGRSTVVYKTIFVRCVVGCSISAAAVVGVCV